MHKIAMILGSIRDERNSARIGAALAQELQALGYSAIDVIDPRSIDLRLPHSPGNEKHVDQVSRQLQDRIKTVDAVLFVAPEYDGSISAVTKVLIEHLGYPSVLKGKPVALLGLATGQIGAVKAMEHLQSIMLHIGAVVVPCTRSIPQVHKVLHADGTITDAKALASIRFVATCLDDYMKAGAQR